MERLQQHIYNCAIFLVFTSATLGYSSTCNTTAAAVSPPSLIPQISPIQSPHSSSPSPIDFKFTLSNNTTASNGTHVACVPETQNNTTTPSPYIRRKCLAFLLDYLRCQHQDPALHTIELEYHLNAYNYSKDRWTQALITTLVEDRHLWAINAL
ncbi:hypothetical protein QOT17_002525 [Balamuthia mandrillaris]